VSRSGRDGLGGLPSFEQPRSVRERIADALRAAVITGELRPGEIYSAPMLAERFGVSATPVREAMLDLVREGMVEPVRNKGFRVTELSDAQLDEYSEIRALIEAPAVRKVAETVDPQTIERLRPLAEQVVAAATSGDVLAYIEADRRFHLALLALAGNAHLVEVNRDLRNRSRLYGVPALAERDELAASSRNHIELLDAIVSGDGPLAERLMVGHIHDVRGIWARPDEESPA
jgi:DNA-binding GntR family transcriptional regulator